MSFEIECMNCRRRKGEHQTLTLACPTKEKDETTGKVKFHAKQSFKSKLLNKPESVTSFRFSRSWPPPCKDCKRSLVCGYFFGKECEAEGYNNFEPVKKQLDGRKDAQSNNE